MIAQIIDTANAATASTPAAMNQRITERSFPPAAMLGFAIEAGWGSAGPSPGRRHPAQMPRLAIQPERRTFHRVAPRRLANGLRLHAQLAQDGSTHIVERHGLHLAHRLVSLEDDRHGNRDFAGTILDMVPGHERNMQRFARMKLEAGAELFDLGSEARTTTGVSDEPFAVVGRDHALIPLRKYSKFLGSLELHENGGIPVDVKWRNAVPLNIFLKKALYLKKPQSG